MPTTVSTICPRYEDYIGKTFKNRLGGETYEIGTLIKSGGEGGVFNVSGRNDLVAKIYSYATLANSQERINKENKINTMLTHPVKCTKTRSGKLLIAWPIDALYAGNIFIGYVMPRVNSKRDLNSITNLTLCHSYFPNFTWKDHVMFAHNLAYSVRLIHEAGHIVGDMNPQNILVSSDGIITIIDTDSFTINDPTSGQVFPCDVGVEEYLAPEIQSTGRVKGRKFSVQTDCFALSVNIFRLLMGGFHPFTLKTDGSKKSQGQTPISTYIAEGMCPFVREISGYDIPVGAPLLSDMPDGISELFTRAFNYTSATAYSVANTRPKPAQWQDALRKLYYNNDNFKECRANVKYEGIHIYYSGLPQCPWCAAKKRIDAANSEPGALMLYSSGNKYAKNSGDSAITTTINPTTWKPIGNSTIRSSPARSQVPLWVSYMVSAGVSGYLLGELFSVVLYNVSSLNIESSILSIVLAVIGVILGGIAAYFFGIKYSVSDKPWAWYMLILTSPFAVFLAGALIAVVLALVVGILYVVLYLIGLAIVIAILCGFCGG